MRANLSGGALGAVSSLPQSVAFGLIAFAPLGPEWAAIGITTSIGTAILFGLITSGLGSNPLLISGPRAMTAVVLGTAFYEALERDLSPIEALQLGFSGVVLAGMLLALAGALRLGQLVSYMPVPVLTGFVNGSAVLVFLSGLSMLAPMGMELDDVVEALLFAGSLPAGTEHAALIALVIGGATLAATLILERTAKQASPALLGLVLGAGLYHLSLASGWGAEGAVIGVVPIAQAVHGPGVEDLIAAWSMVTAHPDIPLLAGASIALLCLFDTVLGSRALDLTTRRESRTGSDLMIHGAANMVMGLLGLLPGSGTLVRSRAMIAAGATNRIAPVTACLFLLFLMVALSPLVSMLPLWAAAGLMMATALQALDRSTLKKIQMIRTQGATMRRVVAGDVVVTLVVIIIAVAFDLIAAIGAGIALAIVLFLLGMGRDPVRRILRGDRMRSHVQRPPAHLALLENQGAEIAVIQLQGALFFGACAALQTKAKALLAQGCSDLVLDMRHLSTLDSSGATLIAQLAQQCKDAQGRLLLSCLEPPPVEADTLGAPKPDLRASLLIWRSLRANGVLDEVGQGAIFDETDTALASCEDRLLQRQGHGFGRSSKPSAGPLFAGLSRAGIQALGRLAQRHRFAPGATLFKQGDQGDQAYLLVSGRMEIHIAIPGSLRQRRVGVLTPGTVFGEMGLLDGAPRSARVRAVAPSLCLSIDRAAFETLQREDPDTAMRLLGNLSRLFADRLRISNRMVAALEQ
ncbi:MAG: SulP family inorganic anion transporter [Rhodospirillaceae bacterium]